MMEQDYWKLLEDEAFVRWVVSPNREADAYWEGWMGEDAHRRQMVEQAREAVDELRRTSLSDSSTLAGEIWQGIEAELHSGRVFAFSAKGRWLVAASVVLLVLGTAFWYTTRTSSVPTRTLAAANAAGNTLIQCSNQTTIPQKVYLVDGSVVTLEPHSSLSYSRLLAQKNREVVLKGSAFFEIAKDPSHPFLVRTGDIVTQVLGTSFRVNDEPDKEDINVVVRTGKVSVYKESDFDNGTPIFCTLLPRQEAVFNKKDHNLAFLPEGDARLLKAPMADTVNLNFDDEPVTNILARLENMYRIRILYDKDSLKECRLTTSLQEEKLADKLDIICKAINAGYHIEGETFVIDGGHCQ